MKSTMRIIYILIIMLMILPRISMAVEYINIYGVTIHLKNNIKLDGYIETDVHLYKCNEKKDDSEKLTWTSFLEKERHANEPRIRALRKKAVRKEEVASENQEPSKLQENTTATLKTGLSPERTVRFINNLVDVQYIEFIDNKFQNRSMFVVAKSSVKEIKIDDIKSIDGVCRKGDGSASAYYIPLITDYMADYISTHKYVASYVYRDDELAKDAGEHVGHCYTIFLSYNPKYTRKELSKLRYKLYKMPDDELEKEGLIRFSEPNI